MKGVIMKSQNNKGNDQRREYTISITVFQEDYEEVIKKSSHLKELRYEYTVEGDKAIVSLECNSKEDIEKLYELLKDIVVN